MTTQVQFGQGSGDNGQLNAGSVFGLSYDEAAYPLKFDNIVEGKPLGGGLNPRYRPSSKKVNRPVMGTVLQGVSSFYHMDAATKSGYTQALANAGYLSLPKKGDPKPQTINAAWKSAVIDAARGGLTIDELLDESAAQFAGGSGSGGSTTIAELSDPATLHKTLDDTAYQLLGRKATAKEKELFTAAIQRAQRQSAGQMQAAQQAGGGVADVTTVSPDARADEFVHQMDPTRYDARQVVANFDVVAKMFGGR